MESSASWYGITRPCGGKASSGFRWSLRAYEGQRSADSVSWGWGGVRIRRTMSAMIALAARGRAGVAAGLRQAHRAAIRRPDLLRLSRQEGEFFTEKQPRRPLARGFALDPRRAVDEEIAADDRQPDAPVLLRISDHALGLAAAHHPLGVFEDAPAHHDDAAIALAQMLLRAVGDRALADPGDEVLVHDVRGDPPVRQRILDRARPVGDPVLLEGLHVVRHAIEEPAHAQHVRVVDGHAPLEVAAGEQAVRPETAAPDGPQLVLLGLAREDAPIGEAVLELLEADLQVRRRPVPVDAVQRARPVRVQPLEVHGVDGVLMTLRPVAGDLREHDLHEAILPGEGLPGRHERRRRRPQVGPEQAGLGLHRIRFDSDAILEPGTRARCLLERLLQAPAGVVPQPAVVVAA